LAKGDVTIDGEKNNCLCRRDFLKTTSTLFAGLAFGTAEIVRADAVRPVTEKPSAKPVLRFAHMPDIHVQPESGADKGLTTALHHAQNLPDPPQMIITGGDTIFDSFAADRLRTEALWKLFHKIVREDCSLPVKSCIGNHDVWGWDKKSSKTTGNEPLWGKEKAVHELNIPNRYYSFDQAGWHLVFLDSTRPYQKAGYIAKLDDEQFNWLQSDLKNTPAKTPVMVVTHEPILSAACFFRGQTEDVSSWVVSGARVHIDARKIKDLFNQHSNVKLCISGHIHLVDGVNYCGVDYVCGGAVSGGWWKGDHQECDEGYGIFDLHSDGTFAYQYVSYGWRPIT